MAYEQIITVSEAAKILNYSQSSVCKMIRDKVITTAFMRSPDGYGGKPGYGMYRSEIEELAKTRVKYKKTKKTVKENKPVAEVDKNKEVKLVLEEIHVCLNLLGECLGKLKEVL